MGLGNDNREGRARNRIEGLGGKDGGGEAAAWM